MRREQDKHVKDVLVNAHESEEVVQKQEQVPFKHVEDALNEKLATIKVEEQSVEGMMLHPLFITCYKFSQWFFVQLAGFYANLGIFCVFD